jgi:hypothetical protein
VGIAKQLTVIGPTEVIIPINYSLMQRTVTATPATYIPEIQKRFMKHCSRIGIRSDKVTFLSYKNVKIKSGKLHPTSLTARAMLGYIPYVFRQEEGLTELDFEYRFEGNYCFITFRK